MAEHIYKIIEIVGTSKKSIEHAIESGIARASSTLDNMRWFEVLQTRGQIDNGKVKYYQVHMKLGFTLQSRGDE